MTHDAQPSDGVSAKTSAAETEAAYLARQSDEARAAIRRALDDLRTSVRGGFHQAADLRAWLERHPWVAVGAASMAGFAAALALTPRAGESVGEKWSRTFSAVTGGSADDQPAANGHAAATPTGQSRSPIWGMLLGPLVGVAKVALENYLIAVMAGQAAAQAACGPDSLHSAAADGAGSATPDEPAASTG